MASFFQRKGVRYCLTAFKWCRVTVLLAVLLLVAAMAYVQLVGLPDYLKNPLLSALRQRGFEAQFASARLGWGASIIIENASFSPTNQAAGPHLSASWTQLQLNAHALLHRRLQVDSFLILDASLRIPLAPTNGPPLTLTDVNLSVALGSNNLAIIHDASAWTRGVRVHINGEIRNYFSLRDWTSLLPSVPAAAPPHLAPSAPRPTPWQVAQTIFFAGAPELNIHFSADGKDENSFRAELQFAAAGTQSPWGQSGPLRLRAVCARLLDSSNAPLFQTRFVASNVVTPWAATHNLSASIELLRTAGTNFTADVHLASRETSASWHSPAGSNWVRVADLHWDGDTLLASPTFAPATLSGTLKATHPESGWGSAGAVSLVFQTARASDASPDDPAWGNWRQIKPFTLVCQAEATNIVTPKLKLDRVAVHGDWHPPLLAIDKIEAAMYHGNLHAGGVLDVVSREVQVHAAVDFDPHQIAPLLDEAAQHWITFYDWDAPPNLSAGLRFVLPPWTNRIDEWPQASRDSIQLAGDFSVGRGSFRGIAVSNAQSHFSYTNRVWNVSDLRVNGPGASVSLTYNWSDLTHAFHFRFDSKLDPTIAVPLLTEAERRTLSEASFLDRPTLRGEVWGNWENAATTGFAGALSTGRLTVRGEKLDQLSTQIEYTNLLLRLSQLKLARDTGRVEIPLATVNFASNIYFLTNGSSTIDPEAVRRALGKIAPPFMREVHFDSPPLVQASGSFTPGDDFGTDMRFFVQGSHFHWNGLSADSAQGEVYYHVRTVDVTNIQSVIYRGKVKGWTTIEWDPDLGTRFRSDATVRDINLGTFAQELTGKTSKIEGVLDGHLALSAPYNASDTNLFGGGWLNVHDGLLWDIKILGIFSPILNAIAPGSGNSRARQATADFIITNGVLATTNLEIKSTGFRLFYRGTVDSKKRLNARVEANLLRDTPVFGFFLGWMLTPLDKMFEYRVTGTLQRPIMQPLYIPKMFMAVLRPFSTLRELRTAPPAEPPATPPPSPPPTPPKTTS
jgi:hypothetical protein